MSYDYADIQRRLLDKCWFEAAAAIAALVAERDAAVAALREVVDMCSHFDLDPDRQTAALDNAQVVLDAARQPTVQEAKP